jgi:tetratricopeptide (TPR) repeat protein
MYSEKLEQLIAAALADGVLTEKEKQILFKRAQAEGVDLDEFEMVLSARVLEAEKSSQSQQPSGADSTGSIDTFLLLARTALQNNNFAEAEQYSNKIIEILNIHSDAWLIKGLSAGWMSTFNQIRLNETINCFQNAINFADDENKQRIIDEAISGIKNLNIWLLRSACDNIANGYLDFTATVQWMIDYTNEWVCPFISSNSASADDMLQNIGFSIYMAANNTFEKFRFNSADCMKSIGPCLKLLDIYAEMPSVSKDSKKVAYQSKIEWCDYVLDVYIGREYDQMRAPLIDIYTDVIKDARSKIRKLNPPKPKKPKTENKGEGSTAKKSTSKKPKTENKEESSAVKKSESKNQKTSKEPEIIYWENVMLTDSERDVAKLKFDSAISKTSWWGGWATDYGVKKAIIKIQKAAAKRGCCAAHITEIDVSGGWPTVYALLYKKK